MSSAMEHEAAGSDTIHIYKAQYHQLSNLVKMHRIRNRLANSVCYVVIKSLSQNPPVNKNSTTQPKHTNAK
jgi:hypothetical protein